MMPFTEEDLILGTGFCHICGQSLLFASMASGSQLAVVRSDENHEKVFQAIERFGVTSTVLIPTQLNWLLKNERKYCLPSLKDVLTGSMSLAEETHENIEKKFGFKRFRNSSKSVRYIDNRLLIVSLRLRNVRNRILVFCAALR